MDIIGLIAATCINAEPSKILDCKSTVSKCVVEEVKDPEDKVKIEECIKRGKDKLKKSCYSKLSKATNTSNENITKHISHCNNLILEEINRKTKIKFTADELADRYFEMMQCENISRNLKLFCEES